MNKRKTYNFPAESVPLKDIGEKQPQDGKDEDADGLSASGKDIIRQTDKVELKRTVTLVNGIGVIVGSIIGSGIFLTPSDVYKNAPDPYGAMAVWGGCGLFSLIGAICFAELGTCVKRSGGDYAYILEAFGDFPAFITLWVTIIVIRPATAAIVALTFAKYSIKPFFLLCDGPEIPEILLAAACLTLLTLINCMSVKLTLKILDIFTAAKLIALVIIILTGFGYFIAGSEILKENSFNQPYQFDKDEKFEWIQVSLAFYQGLFGYAGWNYLNFITAELIDPFRNLPRAIWIGLPLVTAVYVLANAAYFLVLSPIEMKSVTVAIAFGNQTFSHHFGWVIPVMVAMSTFGGVNGTLFSSARLFFAGAEENHMPEILACIHAKRFTPVPALLSTCLISLLMLLLGNVIGGIGQLISFVSFILWVSTGVAVAALIWLRKKQPDLERPIKVNLFFPYTYVILTFFLVACSIYADPHSTGIGTLIAATGVPVYLFMLWQRKRPATEGGCTKSATIFFQKLLNCMPQEKSEPLL